MMTSKHFALQVLVLNILLIASESKAAVPALRAEFLFRLLNPRPAGPGWTNGFAESDIVIIEDRIYVGALFDDEGGPNAGAVQVFETSDGAYVTSILNTSSAPAFAFSLTAIGDQLFVGHPAAPSMGGASGYVEGGVVRKFDATNGTQLSLITDPIPQFEANFGTSLSQSGSNIVIGAPMQFLNRDGVPLRDGAVFVLDAERDTLNTVLQNPNMRYFDWFGQAVDSYNGKIIVGSPGFEASDAGPQRVGRAYVFNGDDGTLIAPIENPDPLPGSLFGTTVQGVHENFAVVGDSRVYLFDGNTFELKTMLLDQGPTPYTFHGTSLASFGNKLLVGSQTLESAYLFDGETGILLLTLTNPDPITTPYFGQSVAINGNMLVVGAYEAAYVYRLVPEPSSGQLTLFAAMVSAGMVRRSNAGRSAESD